MAAQQPDCNGRRPWVAEIKTYRDLVVWQQGMDLAVACYTITRSFPKEETYGMVSQIRRAAASIPANIAEGYGRERRAEYFRFSQIAVGSLRELETHLMLASRVGIVSVATVDPLLEQCSRLGSALWSLLRKLESNSES